MSDVDIEHLATWIGNTESHSEVISPGLIERFRATFDAHLWQQDADIAPLGLHWCLAPPAVVDGALGPDGHPARGGFLPPVPLPSRMWAGGELSFKSPLRAGDMVTRNSKITDVKAKTGKSGALVFVTVEHTIMVGDRLAISERQDIVYKGNAPKLAASNVPAATGQAAHQMGPVQLFRYSAMTFNGHRIHYDRDYAQNEEGYHDLVVHGPLQATLLMHNAARQLDGMPGRFSYRGLAPLFANQTFDVNTETKDGSRLVWVENQFGKTTMKADFL
ncbi:MAG: MaoC family dehydratase N-terminal domain-containing protein [Marinosulfonomonas sp.]|nr:MaoC family dehydratase N-terminal domain-containing protein [Marinosulfonomonas sp.]